MTENNKLTTKIKIGVGSGLHARIKEQQLLKEIQKENIVSMPNRLAIIADCSGSMGSPSVENYSRGIGRHLDSKSNLELMKEGLQDFALRSDTSSTAFAVESFPAGFRIELTNDNQEVWLRLQGIKTLGDTPMGSGLRNALQYHSPTR